MKESKDVVATVIDFGMAAVPFAERLAREGGFKEVYLFQESEEDYTTLNKAIQGEGFKTFTRVADFWDVKKETDLFIFPDVQRSGLQLELESQGKVVWGARKGDEQELDREQFLDTLGSIGLEVPPYTVIRGLNALRAFLRDKKDYYIKVSRYRGSFETCSFRSWDLDECLLDLFAVRFGPAKELVHFLCFPNIDTPLEIGADTYGVDGQFPQLLIHGVEWKDRSYFGAVTNREGAPKQIREVLDKFGPILGRERFRSLFSCEIRIKGSKFYFIDPTCRMGLPSMGSQLELWSNFPEIIWHGANGELIEPKPTAKFCAEAIITVKRDPNEWPLFDIDSKLERWCKFANCFKYKGRVCFPSSGSEAHDDSVGWLVAIGDTPEETIRKINSQADLLPDGMDANCECLSYVIKEIQQMEKSGVHFSDAKMPKAGFVMES